MEQGPSGTHCSTFWLLAAAGFLLGLVPGIFAAVRAEDPPAASDEKEEEPELEGEAKEEHDIAVHELVKYLKTEKNQELVRGKIDELGIQKTRVARDALMEYATDNKNQEFVGYAFRSLAKIGKKKAVEFLCGKEALQSREFLIQRSAAEALQEAKDPRARDALLDVMGGRRTKIQVVGACAKALALCAPKDELVVETLFHFTKNRKDTIRASVVEAIGFLATDEAVDRLKEVLFEDKNARVRAAAATGMGHTKRAETIPFLEKALEEEKAFTVRNACMMAMRVIRGS